MKKKNGFTLVELLAVIVVLAIILVIAVPKVMNIINDAKMSTLKTTAALIISSAEKAKLQNNLLGNNKKIKCSDVVKLSENEYGLCKITFDEEGNASVIINGKENGKFNNLACQGNKDEITCQEGEIKPGLNCTFEGELVQGAEYVNGQYTYRYKQEYSLDIDNLKTDWIDIDEDGWGVILTDKSSTVAVNTPVCSYINDKPLVSTSLMFTEMEINDSGLRINSSNASLMDISSYDTDNVTNMSGMFYYTKNNEIRGLDKLETHNVIAMTSMFEGSKVTSIDLSGFDTSNVIDMSNMFALASKLNSIDLSSFDTSNVIDMSGMFSETFIRVLDLSNFNTSNVTNMSSMFSESWPLSLNLSSFDTSKVTSMSNMFFNIQTDKLDLSSFDTTNVTNMDAMFSGASATKGYARTQADADKFNASDKPERLVFTVK